MKNVKKIKFSDIVGMLEKDDMREIIGGCGSTTGSGSNIYGGGGNAPALGSNPFNTSFSGTNYGGFGGANVPGGGVYGSGSITGAGESSYPGSPYYNGSSSSGTNNLNSSTLSNGYGGGWYDSYNNGKQTTDPNTIAKFYDFLFVNNGIVNNNQINTFINNELTVAGQQQNNIQLYGTVLNNVTVQNNYKGPSTILQGNIIDNVTLFINTSSDSTGTSGNNGSWYAMPKYIHSSISQPSPLEAAFMSKAVYGDYVNPSDLKGWAVSKAITGIKYNNPESGFKSQLYERNVNGRMEYCYATAGTELEAGDIAADILQTVGISLQYQESVNNAKALKMLFGDALSFTGHSLGGGLAEANARATGESATTFNAAGVSYGTTVLLGISFVSDTNSYIMKTDPLNLLQKSTPVLNTAGGVQHFLSAGSQAGSMNGHSINSVIESLQKNN